MSLSALHLLTLIIAANSTPVLLAWLLGERFACPVDVGRQFVDGRPLLGTSKTWRGLIGAILVCALMAPLLGYGVWLGASAGTLAMLGDLLSSFSKRRLGMASSSQAFLLDQVPESLLPALVLRPTLGLSWLDICAVVVTFIILEIILSVIFYRLGVRKRPY